MMPLAKAVVVAAVAPALNAAPAVSELESVSCPADLSHFQLPQAAHAPLHAPFALPSFAEEAIDASPVALKAKPKDKTDFKIAAVAPDKKWDYKMLVAKPNPNVDPEFVIKPSTRRSSR